MRSISSKTIESQSNIHSPNFLDCICPSLSLFKQSWLWAEEIVRTHRPGWERCGHSKNRGHHCRHQEQSRWRRKESSTTPTPFVMVWAASAREQGPLAELSGLKKSVISLTLIKHFCLARSLLCFQCGFWFILVEKIRPGDLFQVKVELFKQCHGISVQHPFGRLRTCQIGWSCMHRSEHTHRHKIHMHICTHTHMVPAKPAVVFFDTGIRESKPEKPMWGAFPASHCWTLSGIFHCSCILALGPLVLPSSPGSGSSASCDFLSWQQTGRGESCRPTFALRALEDYEQRAQGRVCSGKIDKVRQKGGERGCLLLPPPSYAHNLSSLYLHIPPTPSLPFSTTFYHSSFFSLSPLLFVVPRLFFLK